MDAPRVHLAKFERAIAPRSTFDHILHAYLALYPRPGTTGLRDGRRAQMLSALDRLASWSQIREWRRGRRRVPQWAFDTLARKMSERHAELSRALETIERRSA